MAASISQPQQQPIKLTAAQKEQQIMQEIRNNSIKYESKFEGSFLGEIFGLPLENRYRVFRRI